MGNQYWFLSSYKRAELGWIGSKEKKGFEWKKLAASGIGTLLHAKLFGSLPQNPSQEV